MAAWTASSIFPMAFIKNKVDEMNNAKAALPEGQNVIRRALSAPTSTGSGLGSAVGATTRRDSKTPTSTGSGLVAPAAAPAPTSSNMPSFLTTGQNQTTPLQSQDLLSMLTDLITGQQQDPDLTKAQTVLAQQQAMEVARRNQIARQQEANQAAQGYLQSQLKDAAQYQTGSVGNILTQRYNDRLKVLQSGQDLNWQTMPSSSYSVPRRSGWTGPAMPGTWGF